MTGVAFSPDGHTFLTAALDEVRLWQAADGRPLPARPMSHPRPKDVPVTWGPTLDAEVLSGKGRVWLCQHRRGPHAGSLRAGVEADRAIDRGRCAIEVAARVQSGGAGQHRAWLRTAEHTQPLDGVQVVDPIPSRAIRLQKGRFRIELAARQGPAAIRMPRHHEAIRGGKAGLTRRVEEAIPIADPASGDVDQAQRLLETPGLHGLPDRVGRPPVAHGDQKRSVRGACPRALVEEKTFARGPHLGAERSLDPAAGRLVAGRRARRPSNDLFDLVEELP